MWEVLYTDRDGNRVTQIHSTEETALQARQALQRAGFADVGLKELVPCGGRLEDESVRLAPFGQEESIRRPV
jgi:hypothetical protein